MYCEKSLKISISRTIWPISSKLYANHSCMKEIYVFTDKGPGPLQSGNNHQNSKIGWSHFKIYISRTTGSEKLKFKRKLADMIETQIVKIMVTEG
jgi:hypothetical protein